MHAHPTTHTARSQHGEPEVADPNWPAGWSEFVAARQRFLSARARDAAVVRLERAWRAPAAGPEAGPDGSR